MPQSKPRKPIADLIEELKSWLPNYDHGPTDYPTLLWRILASLPGGDRAEDMGYETFQLGWQEATQLGDVLAAIQDQRDVSDLIDGLVGDEEEEGGEVDEARRNPSRGDQYEVRANGSTLHSGTVRRDAEDAFDKAASDNYEGKRHVDEEIEFFKNGKLVRSFGPKDFRPKFFHLPAAHETSVVVEGGAREPVRARATGNWGPGKWFPSEARREHPMARDRRPTAPARPSARRPPPRRK